MVEFWNTNRRLGSRLGLMHASIDGAPRRARPKSRQHQSHFQGSGFVKVRASESAAATWRRSPRSASPTASKTTGPGNQGGPTRIGTIPTPGSFLPGQYLTKASTVRSGSSSPSVREFLTAEWLNSLLVDEGSRVRIENLSSGASTASRSSFLRCGLFFPWLTLFDPRILTRIMTRRPRCCSKAEIRRTSSKTETRPRSR